MQNRLNAVKENRDTLEKQVAEVRAAIEAERQARPDSVGIHFFDATWIYVCVTMRDFAHEIYVTAME